MSVTAPWTDEQVAALNEFQRLRRFHPFTCGSGNRSDAAHLAARDHLGLRDNGALVATREGWICPACDYTQDWAHEFMFKPLSAASADTRPKDEDPAQTGASLASGAVPAQPGDAQVHPQPSISSTDSPPS